MPQIEITLRLKLDVSLVRSRLLDEGDSDEYEALADELLAKLGPDARGIGIDDVEEC